MLPTRTRATLAGGLLAALSLGACTAEPDLRAPVPVRAVVAPSPPQPYTVVALGDSYTQGFSSCGRPGDCPTTAWATGSDRRVLSLRQRLERSTGRAVVGHNLSVSGARVRALNRQAVRVAATRADLVAVLVGVNDVCAADVASMTTPAAFRADLERALATLDRTSPQAALLVLSVPDLGRMADLGRPVQAARAVWARHGICPPVFGRAAVRSETDARRRAFDAHLEQACAARVRCTWDGGALGALRFGPGFLSPDWFHPSLAGQTAMAQVAATALGVQD